MNTLKIFKKNNSVEICPIRINADGIYSLDIKLNIFTELKYRYNCYLESVENRGGILSENDTFEDFIKYKGNLEYQVPNYKGLLPTGLFFNIPKSLRKDMRLGILLATKNCTSNICFSFDGELFIKIIDNNIGRPITFYHNEIITALEFPNTNKEICIQVVDSLEELKKN